MLPGQFRNWFYALLAMSTMMENKAPFKVLLGHAWCAIRPVTRCTRPKGIPFLSRGRGHRLQDQKSVQEGESEEHPPMGADLIRWMFCRHSPSANINFGPDPAEELRARFVLKLWNTYAFFVNYAFLDDFDPAAPVVPVKDRRISIAGSSPIAEVDPVGTPCI